MIGVYIHIPFCRRKCAYCDFYSECDLDKIEPYVDALCRAIDRAPKGIRVDTVFVGGGTPSLLAAQQWMRLFAHLRGRFQIDSGAEVSVEANPDSLHEGLCRVLVSCGVNRLSLGVQSLDDRVLTYAGRLHTAARAVEALRLAGRYFDNINADYMVGFPFQTPDSVAADIHTLCALGIKHASVYGLQVEQGTPLAARLTVHNDLPDADYTTALYDAAMDALSRHGLQRYEISNFCLAGYRCRHNDNCWHYHDYLGFGPGAHSFVQGHRFYQGATLDQYCKGVSLLRSDVYNMYSDGADSNVDSAAPWCDPRCLVAPATAKFEMVMLALRTVTGLRLADYRAHFGTDFDADYAAVLADPRVVRATKVQNGRFFVLPDFLYLANSIIELFIPDC